MSKDERELPPDWDPGPPLPEIESLREEAPDALLDLIRSGILRRVGSGQLLDFTIPMILEFLRELGALLFGASATAARPATQKEGEGNE